MFFLPSAGIRCLPISEKTVNFGNKKHFEIFFISGDKKTFSQLCFLCLFFFVALINFKRRGQFYFYFIALINFSRNLSNIFFYLVALNNIFKNRLRKQDGSAYHEFQVETTNNVKNIFFYLAFFTTILHG